MPTAKRLCTRGVLVAGAVTLLAGGSAIRMAVRPLATGRLPL